MSISGSQMSGRPPAKPKVLNPMDSRATLPVRMNRSAQDRLRPYFCLMGHSRRRALSRLPLSGQLLSGAKRWLPVPAHGLGGGLVGAGKGTFVLVAHVHLLRVGSVQGRSLGSDFIVCNPTFFMAAIGKAMRALSPSTAAPVCAPRPSDTRRSIRPCAPPPGGGGGRR